MSKKYKNMNIRKKKNERPSIADNNYFPRGLRFGESMISNHSYMLSRLGMKN